MAREGSTDISNVPSGAGGMGSFNAEGLAEFLVKDEDGDKGKPGEGGTDELTSEQISEQLIELKAKDQSTLTDDDKTFLEKHDEKKVTIEDLKNKPEDQRSDEEKKAIKDHDDKVIIDAIEAKDESERTDEEKQALADYIEANKPPSIIEQVVERLGNIEGDFTDDVDGIVALIEKVGDTSGNNKANEMLTKFPEVGQLLQHRVKGGSLDSFMRGVQVPDYSKIELSKDNVEGLRDMYTTYLKSTGLSLKDISTLVQNAEDEGEDTLLNKAKEGQLSMATVYNAEVKATVDSEEVQKLENDVRVNAYWEEVNIVLKSGKIEGIQIPKDDLQVFESFIKDKDAQQNTKIDYEYAKLTTGQRMFLDYLVYKKFDVKGLNLERKSVSKSLSETLGKGASINKLGNATEVSDNKVFDISELIFDPAAAHVVQGTTTQL